MIVLNIGTFIITILIWFIIGIVLCIWKKKKKKHK